MAQMFWYKRREPLPLKEGEKELQFKEFMDSFNIDKIIRTISLDDERILVLLSDIHERMQDVPMFNKKHERTGTKKERMTVQSEIYLEKEDAEKFYKLTSEK